MDYTEINGAEGFKRNMRRTPWLKLFPHWWSENDALLNVIGDEVERIKALAFFSLLNAGIKPPVMIWQNSLVHKEHHINRHLTELKSYIDIQAPLYKTWGKITLINNTSDDISNLKIMITESDGITINKDIHKDDIIVFDLLNQTLDINDKKVEFININEGIPYFKTVQNLEIYDESVPLHNAVIRMEISAWQDIECDIEVDIQLDDVVFTNEQNIEVTGLELLPIEKVELYVKHDFEFNPEYNGWHKIYQKKYDKNTNVLYDMITTQIYTYEFYVHVWYKELQYPYKVGFPCYQDADADSMYHVNNRLDTWGEQLGLQRRNYKKNIDEKDYARTFPPYYPFDIEQDYWYYKRLTNEYAWNDLAINDIDIKDTEGNNVLRLYSINPFIEDFVVHAKSRYSIDKEYKSYQKFTPVLVSQQSTNKRTQQSEYTNIKNVLQYDDRKTSVRLSSNSGDNIYKLKYQSKELWTFFDLSILPEDVNIDNIKILIEGDSLDNKKDKNSSENTGLFIESLDGNSRTFIPLQPDKSYQLSEQEITYSSNQLIDYINKHYKYEDKHIKQTATIGRFSSRMMRKDMQIPFKLEENGEIVDDITEVWIYYDNTIQKGKYIRMDKTDVRYITVDVPNVPSATKMTIVCKSETHAPFTTTIDIGSKLEFKKKQNAEQEEDPYLYNYIYEKDEGKTYIEDDSGVYIVVYKTDLNGNYLIDDNGKKIEEKRQKIYAEKEPIVDYKIIQGPYANGILSPEQSIVIVDDWRTKDLRNILQKQGLFFRNIFENNNEQSETTINIKNITLEISYSDKKSLFTLDTRLHKSTPPKIGEYEITITNIGEKILSTDIDIISAPNIQLTKNYIKVDNLKVNESKTEIIDIYSQSSVTDDGYYDIVAICEDVEKRDRIGVFSTGLIDTGVRLPSHHGRYETPITVKAYFSASGNKITDKEHISFYVNERLISEEITLENNVATITFDPKDYNFITPGIMPLDVKYIGNNKYAPCSARNEIFIGKSNTNVKLQFDKAILSYQTPETFQAKVTYIDENNEERPVDDGTVSFYIDDIPLGTVNTQINGVFTLTTNVDIAPGIYTLWARYDNSNKYAMDEDSLEVRVTGDKVNINVFDIQATPVGPIEFKARVLDSDNYVVESGCVRFTVLYQINQNGETIDLININTYGKIVNGVATANATLNITDIGNIGTINATIEANLYQPDNDDGCESNGYLPSEENATGTLTVSKHEVEFIHQEQFLGTQFEPLGFFIDVVDKVTGAPVTDGTLELEVVGQEITASTTVVDGKAILVFHPMTLVESWDKTGDFNLLINDDESTYNLTRNGEVINLKDRLDSSIIKNNEDKNQSGHLYLVTEKDGLKVHFEIDGENLIYTDLELEENQVLEGDKFFYLKGRNLYRISSVDNLQRKYNTGQYRIKLHYTNSLQHTSITKYIQNGLVINESDVNLDLYTYDNLSYTNKNIKCYTSYRDSEDKVEGTVNFYVDDEQVYSSPINNQIAQIPTAYLKTIENGAHLLKAEYYTDNGASYTYSTINIDKITPIITITPETILKGQKSKINVTIKANDSDIQITGFVHLYLNDTLIRTEYLYGNENMQGIVDEPYTASTIGYATEEASNSVNFFVVMPDDIDVNDYTIKAEYEGNNLIKSKIQEISVHQDVTEVELSCDPTYIAIGQECLIPIKITAETNPELHNINEGYVVLIHNNEEIKKFTVANNLANLRFTPEEGIYEIAYEETPSYHDTINNVQHKYVLGSLVTILPEPQLEIEYDETRYQTLRDAIQCLQENGTLIINDEHTLDTPFEVLKPITIKGGDNGVINLANDFILNSNITIEDIQIKTDNNSKIVNKKQLKIIHSILNADVQSSDTLTINRCLVYNRIDATEADLNNNWWGQNSCPYNVSNYIILTLNTDNTPAVIIDDIEVYGELIGINGVKYSIPAADFKLTADTGIFSIDSGKTINGRIHSTYMDATEEGKIYLTVDNQTVECDIYDYNRKTEIIIDPIYDVPVNHYIGLKANIRSCTDNYHENSNMNGYVDWYIDNQQIGHSYILNNYSTINTYLNDYDTEKEHTIKAVYKPYEYYFGSSQEININIIETDKAIYVSPYGYDTEIGDGSFDAPYATINRALEDVTENNYTIYLKDGEYNENNININNNLTIKGYGDDAVFTGVTENAIFNNNAELHIENIHFINNQVDNLFNNSNHIYIKRSLIKDNKSICNNNDYKIEYSAILTNENEITGTTINCWFGNNDDVKLTLKASKSEIYEGVVALLTAKLVDKNGNELEESLPSRIAQFISDDFSLRPLEDYTYRNNKATSLLDTNAESNKNKTTLTILDTTQYINSPINIKCHAQDGLQQDVDGVINFKLMQNGKEIVNTDIDTVDGYATLTHTSLNVGEYELICTYNDTVTSANITVKKDDIQIKNFNLLSSTNHKTEFQCTCVNGLNEPIDDLMINVFIDNNYLGKALVTQGSIASMFTHDVLKEGRHTLKLSYQENEKYDTLIYTQFLFVGSIDTNIQIENNIDNIKITQNKANDIEIRVLDDYGQFVSYGTITIYFDGDMIYENQALTNGKYILKDFIIKERGQHSLIILYSGNNNFYNSSSRKYVISTDIYPIEIKDLYDFDIDLNDKITINNDVVDIASRLVSAGEVTIFFNDIQISQSIPIEDGHLTFKNSLPIDTKPGTYSLKIYYTDDSDAYLDTLITKKVTVNKIKTNIEMNDIIAYPDQEVQVPFSITSKHGKVNTGIIEISYGENTERINIYNGFVSEAIFNYAIFTAPNWTQDIYELDVKYIDNTGYYEDKNIKVDLNIQRNNVIIEPIYNAYYPKQSLLYIINIKNKDGKRVNTGYVDIYIDGVKEHDDIKVINGQASANLLFNQSKTYKINILYKDDEYYLNTGYSQDFFVGRLDINEIAPIYNDSKTKITSLDFNTVGDYNVTDGIVSIYIDDIEASSYYIKERDKAIDLDISYLTKGNHNIVIKYNSSEIFNDYTNNYTLYIEPKHAEININTPLTANVNGTLDIQGRMSQEISGVINFKIGNKYIGSTLVNSLGIFSYEYELPITFTEEEYTITAIFDGNPYYESVTKDITLQLVKNDLQDDEMKIISPSINELYDYQSMIEIEIETEIDNPAINLSIKNLDNDEIIKIGRTTTKQYQYMLDDTLVKNQNGYQVIGEYSGSPVYNPTTIYSKPFSIKPYTPEIIFNQLHGYVGGDIMLQNNIFKNAMGDSITSGEVKYIFGEEEITVTNEGYTYTLPSETYGYNVDGHRINVQFISNDTNKYTDAQGEMYIKVDKNNAVLNIETPEYFNLDETFSINIKAQSNTTSHNIESIKMNDGSTDDENTPVYTLTDNQVTIEYEPSVAEDLHLTFTIDDSIFNFNQVLKIIPLNRGEYNNIDSTSDIESVINSITDGGTLVITEPLTDKNISIDKDLTIKGNAELTNCLINHAKGNLIIDGPTFNDSHIISQDNIDINNCTFINTNINKQLDEPKDAAIKLNGTTNTITNTAFANNTNCIYIEEKNIHTTIDQCIFNDNNASLYGACIETLKVNELIIKDTQFINNNNETMGGACIYTLGKLLIYNSVFYNNNVNYDIRLIKGNILGDICAFADNNKGNNILRLENNAKYDLDYNYWGENDIPIEVENYLNGTINEDENKAYIQITNAHFNAEEITRDFEKSYTVEVIRNGD